MGEGPTELRLVITAPDYDAALRFYRDVLGLREEAAFVDDNGGRATLLSAGRATIELADEAHADAIDALEVGRRVAGPVRIAFEVDDAAVTTSRLVDAGARLVASPVRTPWGSLNARLVGPDGQHLTVFSDEPPTGDMEPR
jgi:predicted enzyme related to lactoylglutathione lyase